MSDKIKDAEARGFERGVLWAVARMVEMHDEPFQAAEILKESGIGLDLKKADEFDRQYLRKLCDELPFRKR